MSTGNQEDDTRGESVPPLNFERFCELAPLNWEALPALRDRLRTHNLAVERESITLVRYPDSTTYSAWAPALADVREKGEPKRYTIQFVARGKRGTSVISIQRD